MTQRIAALLACAACAALLAACGSDEEGGPHRNAHLGREPGQSGSYSLFGGGKSAPQGEVEGLAVNAYLWRGALDTLKFMPLASADPFGGVIITDWYAPPASPDERFKVTIYILDRQLNAAALKAAVFRQTKDATGNWIDAAVDAKTAQKLEDEILTRARELRIVSSQTEEQKQ